ncbi:MAG: hypothetical protein M0Z63_01905 [Actinomycetota bacterium]|nr:hypothetical protein [Actinomycetota bacterium]
MLHGDSRQFFLGNDRQVVHGNSRQVLHGNSRQVLHGNSRQVVPGNSRQAEHIEAQADVLTLVAPVADHAKPQRVQAA